MRSVITIAGGIILALVVLAGWTEFMRGLRPALRDVEHATKAATASTATAADSQWTYSSKEDDMGRGIERLASVKSTNELEFGFPYRHPQHATLWLRTHPRHGKNVILEIERGQFLCPSYEGCTVLVRFDEGAAARYSAVGPADYNTTYIFVRNYESFVSHMWKAKSMRVQAEFYQEGAPTLEFDVSGFEQTKYNP